MSLIKITSGEKRNEKEFTLLIEEKKYKEAVDFITKNPWASEYLTGTQRKYLTALAGLQDCIEGAEEISKRLDELNNSLVNVNNK